MKTQINVKVNFYEDFRHITGKNSEILSCASNTNLEGFIRYSLIKKYGDKFKKLTLDEKNNINNTLLILVNGKIVKNISSFKLSDNDEITLLLPVAGG